MIRLFKEFFYKIGLYNVAKKYLKRPYIWFIGIKFKLHSKNAIKNFLNTMNENGYEYWLEFGTLLGAIRENGIIAHDNDIDVAMHIGDRDEKMEKKLRKGGFNLIKRARLLTGEIIEETYKYKTATIDVFYAYKKDGKIHIYDYQTLDGLSPNECVRRYGGLQVHRNSLNDFELTNYSFFDLETKVPGNYHEHLIELYNQDYMKPNKNWSLEYREVRKKTDLFALVEYF